MEEMCQEEKVPENVLEKNPERNLTNSPLDLHSLYQPAVITEQLTEGCYK